MAQPAKHHLSGREALLESAAVLFGARGYASVSTREIADRAGVNIALIQYHFGSKSALFLEVVEYLTENSRNLIENLGPLPDSMSPFSAAVGLCHFIRDFMAHLLDDENNSSCKLVFREMFSERSHDPEFFDAVLQFILERHAGPIGDRIGKLVQHIQPTFSREELERATHSIIGQCTFYASHRPIIDSRSSQKLTRHTARNEIAPSISIFSLRGLGCDEALVSRATREAFQEIEA